MKVIKTIKDVSKEDLIVGGTFACASCGSVLGLKLLLKALGENTIIVNASGCMTLLPTYPFTPFKVPWLHLAIENAGATCSGIWAAMKSKGKRDINIVAYAGDGATYDIGLQSLSGAVERGDNFIYVCYNNSSFANTGVQRSSATPFGMFTTTTPTGINNPIGNFRSRKPLPKIIAAHDAPYVATACVSYPLDFISKLQKAALIEGPKFIDLLTPCQPGWGFDTSQTIEVGKLAVLSGMWPLYEIENRKFRLTFQPPKLVPIKDFFKLQKRFSHLDESTIKEIQDVISKEWKMLTEGKYWETSFY